jgi:hypothetical protein
MCKADPSPKEIAAEVNAGVQDKTQDVNWSCRETLS